MRLALTGFLGAMSQWVRVQTPVLLCDNEFVFKQLCSAPEGGHRTLEMQTEQAEKSYDIWVRVQTALFSPRRRT